MRPFYGWIVVAGGFLVLFMAYGTQYAFGIFFGALLGEFGWSRASLSGAFSLYTVAYSACALAAGRLTDRWGPRTVIALGGGFLGLGLIGMSRTTALWHPYVLIWWRREITRSFGGSRSWQSLTSSRGSDTFRRPDAPAAKIARRTHGIAQGHVLHRRSR